MDINLILCDEDGESRSLDFFRKECLDLFINGQTMALEVDPTKLIRPKDKLQHIALQQLEKEGTLVSYSGVNGTTTYFLAEEIWDMKKDFSLSIDALTNISDLYNTVMPSLISEMGLFKPISPLDVDVPVLEALLSVLHLSIAANILESHLTLPEDNLEDDSEENTFSFS